jgi:hypothetical protein
MILQQNLFDCVIAGYIHVTALGLRGLAMVIMLNSSPLLVGLAIMMTIELGLIQTKTN